MKTTDKVWIKSMDIFDKYWGCHQMPDRSFFIFSYQLPICARCTGIMFGEILGVFSLLLKINIPYYLLLIFLCPMILDGTIQYFNITKSNNIRRFITGLLFGFSIVCLFFKIIGYILLTKE